jgi:ABC-2 type transport system ATP-binding protein
MVPLIMSVMVIEQLAHTRPAVAVSGVTKSYGAVPAVRGVNLGVAPGETVAILGPNGAGKTTTIDMILGLIRPDAGTVSIFGATPQIAVHQGWVGGMLQTGSPLDHLRVRELVALVASYYPNPLDVDDVLVHTGLAECARQWTNRLSGGEAQRVRFATALVGNPDLLILDEPTAAIDVEGRRQFWAAIRGFSAEGKTVIFATHYLEEADSYADRAVLMAHGRIVADGPVTEIKAHVGRRTVRATLPAVEVAPLLALPGVLKAERHGDTITLSCSDADAATAALLRTFPAARDLEVHGSSLEDAFVDLTVSQSEETMTSTPTTRLTTHGTR